MNKSVVFKYIFMISVLLISPILFSGFEPRLKTEGVVRNFDQNSVQLVSEGSRIVVPRNSIPKRFKIKSGKRVFSNTDSEHVRKLIIEFKNNKKMKSELKK